MEVELLGTSHRCLDSVSTCFRDSRFPRLTICAICSVCSVFAIISSLRVALLLCNGHGQNGGDGEQRQHGQNLR